MKKKKLKSIFCPKKKAKQNSKQQQLSYVYLNTFIIHYGIILVFQNSNS